MDKNDITVVVTHYNTPDKLMQRCIASLEKYGLKYIIIDDGSDDEHVSNLSKYKNVTIYLRENTGPYIAWKHGLECVDTKYVMRVDSDDYIIGVPDVSTGRDAYVNNLHGKISLAPKTFRENPFAGLGGIVVKTWIMDKIWQASPGYMFDVVIFHRLLIHYKPIMNRECLYVYEDNRPGSVTKTMRETKMVQQIRKDRVKMMGDEAFKLADPTRYGTWDNEEGQFRDYTFEEPETEQEIIDHFWDFNEARSTNFTEFTMAYIAETWNVEFIREDSARFKEMLGVQTVEPLRGRD